MQRRLGAEVQLRYIHDRDYFDSTELQMKETLAALQRLLPSRHRLQERVSHSKELEDVAQLVQCEFKSAPADVQEQAAVLMTQLQYCLGRHLLQWINLPQARFSSPPHWLDRIKRVEEVLASLPPVAGSEKGMACAGRKIAPSCLSLSEYQANKMWHQALVYS